LQILYTVTCATGYFQQNKMRSFLMTK